MWHLVKIEEFPRLAIQKKLNVGAPFRSRPFVNNYGWIANKQYRFVPPIYIIGSLKQWFHWRNMFISSPTKLRRCINGDFAGFDLPKCLIYYRTTYSIHWIYSAKGLVLLPLKNDARIIATLNYENKLRPTL